MKKTDHAPRWRYDCDRCKFNWNCGVLSACIYVSDPKSKRRYLPEPPDERQREINQVRLKEGYLGEWNPACEKCGGEGYFPRDTGTDKGKKLKYRKCRKCHGKGYAL